MCATFQLTFDDIAEIKNIADEISKKYGTDTAHSAFNTDYYPKGKVPVIGKGNKVSLLTWGLPLKGSKQVVFNARAESLEKKAMFKGCLNNRCLVPATAFYEWSKVKTKYRISFEGQGLIYMAALWQGYIFADGSRKFCFTIITTEPKGLIKNIHSRMPVIILPDKTEEWLRCDADTISLLKPYEEGLKIVSCA